MSRNQDRAISKSHLINLVKLRNRQINALFQAIEAKGLFVKAIDGKVTLEEKTNVESTQSENIQA